MVGKIAKKAFRAVIRYDLYWIYKAPDALANVPVPHGVTIAPVDATQVAESPYVAISRLVGFDGPQSAGFGAWADGKLVAACWFWWGDRYRTRGNLWPIGSDAAKLVQITTDPSFSGRGIASALMTVGVQEMRKRGFAAVYARIWHSHAASLHTFQKAGWFKSAFAARIWGIPLRFTVR